MIYYEIPDYFSLFFSLSLFLHSGRLRCWATGQELRVGMVSLGHEFIGISRSGKRVRDDGSHGVKQKKTWGGFGYDLGRLDSCGDCFGHLGQVG